MIVNYKKILIFSVMILVFGFGVIGNSLAASSTVGIGQAGENLKGVAGETGLKGDLSTALGSVIQGVLSILGTIFFIMMVYAGVLWTSARGNEDQVTKAKDIITAAIIGLVITMGAFAITVFVSSRLGGQ